MKGVETKQAGLVKRKSRKGGTRNHPTLRSSKYETSLGLSLELQKDSDALLRASTRTIRLFLPREYSDESSSSLSLRNCFDNAHLRGFGSISFADLSGSVRRARRCIVERGKGARVLDGVSMVDEDGANVCIIVQGWYVGREIKVVWTYLEQGLVAATKTGVPGGSSQYRK